MTIDIEELRENLKEECYAAYFVEGFGAALVEASDLDDASPEELAEMAQENGVDLSKYSIGLSRYRVSE